MIYRPLYLFLLISLLLFPALPAFGGSFEGTAAYRKQDYAAARAEFGSAAEETPLSRYFLALMNFRGEGGPRDDARGMELLRASSDGGYPHARYLLGSRLLLSGREGWKELLKSAAESGEYRARAALEIVAKGKAPGEASVVAAVRSAAAKGKADAEYTLGFLHLTGEGVARDPKREIALYRSAATHGHRLAPFLLSLLYQSGEGVKKDPREAARFMKLAAERGHLPAQFFTASFYYSGFGFRPDHRKAAEWMRKAAVKGYAPAQSAYGMLLLSGDGVAVDKVAAMEWLGKAARQGDEGARETLQELVALHPTPLGKQPELKNPPPPILEQPKQAEEGVRLEGKGIILDRGEFGLKFSLPDLNDIHAPASANRESPWSRLQGGKFEIILRPGG